MKNNLLVGLLLSTLLMSCSSSKNDLYLIGAYTDNSNQGISFIHFDTTTKEIYLKSVIDGIENPSFVIANKAKTYIVAVEETASKNGGKVSSFAYDKKAQTFKKLSTFYTKGDHPCTLALSPDENFVLVGNYSGGSLSVFPVNKQGELSESSQFIQYEGKSVNAARQEKPHVHCIVFHPKQEVIAVADLGSDVIRVIPFDDDSSTFLQVDKTEIIKVVPGSGPRHLVWNKAGTKLYATFELTNEVGVFEYQNNQLKQLQTIPLTAPTKSGSAAELRLSNDGQFLYASVRGTDNQIVVMKISENEKLEVIQTVKTAVMPRNFILTANQKQILVATQVSGLISVFDRDVVTGFLTSTNKQIEINKPVYLFPF